MDTVEIAFYIHGVSPHRRGREHFEEYESLHMGIAGAAGEASLWPNGFGGAEWGWNFDEGRALSHKALTDAQRILTGKLLPIVKDADDWPTGLSRFSRKHNENMRALILNGFGDLFYYVSSTGKWAVRFEVARQLVEHLEQRTPEGAAVSLTLLGHSAGSVIAFDLLYYLFGAKKPQWLKVADFPYGKSSGSDRIKQEVRAVDDALRKLRKRIKDKKLRLRRLITFGSPLSFLMFRSDWLVENFAKGGELSAEDHGLNSELVGSPLEGPRWINLWDKDDLIAWPVKPIMNSPLVEDVYVDISDSLTEAHNEYWTSPACHVAIAKRW